MPNWAKTSQKRDKKISFWVPFHPAQVGAFLKKSQKIKKHHFGFISSKTGLGHAKKELKKISFQGPFLLDPGWSIPKKIEKYSTNFFLKNVILPLISSKTRPRLAKKEIKKIFIPSSAFTQPRLENS